MKSSVPARSGSFPARLGPRLAAPLLALFAGCALLSPNPDGEAARSGANGASGGRTVEAGGQPAAPGTKPGSGHAQVQERGVDDAEAEAAENETEAASAEQLPEVELTSQLLFQLLASEIAAQRGELGSAATTYLALARQTRDPRLARRATELALRERSLDRALPAAQLWHELAPGSMQAAQTLESLLLGSGRLAEAEPLLRSRLERARADGSQSEAYSQLQRSLARAADREAAFALLERVAEPDAELPQARLALAAQARAAGNYDRAAAEADAALRLAPDDESVAVVAAQHAGQGNGGSDAAIEMLQKFLERNPQALEARFELARWLAGAERHDAAREQFELALEQKPDSPAILFSLAQLAWQTKQPEAAEQYLNRYIGLADDVRRDNSPAWLFLGQIAEEDGRLAEAIDRYARVGPGEQYLPAQIRRALLLGRQGRLDDARELLKQTPATNNRARVQLIAAEAQLLRESGRTQDAVDLLAEALERLPENPELLYDYAMAAERIDRVDLMETSLRKLIELRPDYAHAYNALGYTFADRNMRLDEALELIEKANELRPDDPHIIDSLGWVMYRLGNLPRAIELLRRAYALSPEIDIAVHLGEVLWKSGHDEEARKIWRDAHRREPGNAVLRETLARLEVRL